MGFLAELTEQNHETSHGEGGDMCEGTAASARPWLARGRMFARRQKRPKNHGQKTTFKKPWIVKDLKKNTVKKNAFKKGRGIFEPKQRLDPKGIYNYYYAYCCCCCCCCYYYYYYYYSILCSVSFFD